jgi:hypothetical protein
MRFYLDECMNPEIAVHALALGLDVTDWKSADMGATDDAAQLRHAASEGRCIVTANCRHFKKVTRALQEAGGPHAGVLCLKPTQFDMSDAKGIAATLQRFAELRPDGLAAYEVVSDSSVIRGLHG